MLPHKSPECLSPACRRIGAPALFFLAAAMLSAACDKDSPTEPSGTLVGPAGGSFAFADSSVLLIVPPGALSEEVTIWVEPTLVYPERARVVEGTVYTIGPTLLELFEPTELRIDYREDRVPPNVPESDLRLYRVAEGELRLIRGSGVWPGDDPPLAYGTIEGLGTFGIAGLSATEGLSGSVSPDEVTLVVGGAGRLVAHEEFRHGLGPPNDVAWTVSNASVLRVVTQAGDSCVVEGLTAGEAIVNALIDDQFSDSVEVRVVESGQLDPGDVLWKAEAVGTFVGSPSLDAQGRIHVVETGGHQLVAFQPDGTMLFSEPPTCGAYLGPSVTSTGSAYVAGLCAGFDLGFSVVAARHAPDGSLLWYYPFEGGWADGGLAVAPDGAAVLLHNHDGGIVVVTRLSADGTLVRRDTLSFTLQAGSGSQRKAPVIASNGDVYVWWFDAAGSWLSRLTAQSGVRWTVAAPDIQRFYTSPALTRDRVAIAAGRLAVHDSSGALLWDAALGTWASSPAIDGLGNLYVQSSLGLYSYDASGMLRWAADSLGYHCTYNIGAPSLLANGRLLVACDGELCSVDMADGSLGWRTDLGGGLCGAAAVAANGTIYVVVYQRDHEWGGLIALQGDAPLLTEGWPTEGGGMGRLRRQQP